MSDLIENCEGHPSGVSPQIDRLFGLKRIPYTGRRRAPLDEQTGDHTEALLNNHNSVRSYLLRPA